MIKVYNADRALHSGDGAIFKHFATSPVEAANRIEGMYTHQNMRAMSPDGWVNIRGYSGGSSKKISLDEDLKNFCQFASQFSINEYDLHISNPLKLNDLWEDDPIGSAGPRVIGDERLTPTQRNEAAAIFEPFSDIIFPWHIKQFFSNNDIKSLKKRYSSDPLFQQELKKRKARSKAVGEIFKESQFQEIVWLHYTLELRMWAINHGYDSFIYKNQKEGTGGDSIVILEEGKLISSGSPFIFMEDHYLSEMPSRIKYLLSQVNTQKVQTHVLWAQADPMRYWSVNDLSKV